MHACIVVKNKTKYDLQELQETLQSLKSRGFQSFQAQENPDLTAAVYLYPGEKLQNEETSDFSLISFDGGIFQEKRRGIKSFVILASKHTPTTEFIDFLRADSIQSIKKFVKKYPNCLESHFKYASRCMQNRNYETAFTHFEIGRKWLNRPLKVKGWVQVWHQYVLDFESSLCAYYVSELEKGRFYADRVITNAAVPQQILNRTYQNYEFYIQPLEVLWTKEYFVKDMEDIPPAIGNYKSLNPSLLALEDGNLYLNIRIVNWSVNPIGFNQYTTPHPKNKFKTKNILGIISGDGEYIQKPRLVSREELEIEKLRPHRIDGFEDCRLFAHSEGGSLHFITNYTKNNPKGDMRLSLGTISHEDESVPMYTSLTPIVGYGDHLTQKNWLLYDMKDNNVKAIYGYNPFTIIEIDLESGVAKPLSQVQLPIRSGEFRGSGGPIAFEDGYLLVIHQVYYKPHGGRRYLHRFIRLDKDYIPIAISMSFYLQSKDIEYISTMVKTDSGKVLIGYGLCDKCACLTCVDMKTISKMLIPIGDYL